MRAWRAVLIFSRAVLARPDLSLFALLLLTACSKPTEVELRLYPCGAPDKLDLDIQGYDGEGKALPLLQKSFVISDPGVFGDEYATVGLSKPDGMVTADFTLTWHEDGALAVVVLTGKNVPDVGEVLELGADGCMPVGGTTIAMTEPTSSTGASTSTSTGPASTSTGDDTTTGSTGTATTMESTTDVGTTSTTTTGTDTSTGDMTTGEETLLGKPCDPDDPQGAFYCEGSGPGLIGTLLECEVDEWVTADCNVVDCAMIQFTMPVAVGCSGVGYTFACVCQEMTPVEVCMTEDQGCDMNDNMTITLCHEGFIAKTVCAMCSAEDEDLPVCVPN